MCNDPRFIQFIYHYSHVSKSFVYKMAIFSASVLGNGNVFTSLRVDVLKIKTEISSNVSVSEPTEVSMPLTSIMKFRLITFQFLE